MQRPRRAKLVSALLAVWAVGGIALTARICLSILSVWRIWGAEPVWTGILLVIGTPLVLGVLLPVFLAWRVLRSAKNSDMTDLHASR